MLKTHSLTIAPHGSQNTINEYFNLYDLYYHIIYSMVLILEGNSEIGAYVRSNLSFKKGIRWRDVRNMVLVTI